METKICPGCGIEKAFSEYYKNNTKKNKIRTECKACTLIKSREYDANHREKRNLAGKKYRDENKEKIILTRKKYNDENKEKLALINKKYREENKEKVALINKKYREENNEKIALIQKKFRDENKEKLSLSHKKYYEANKEKMTLTHKNYYEENKEELKIKRKEFYDNNFIEILLKNRERKVNNVYVKLHDNLYHLIYNHYKIPSDGLLWYYLGCTCKFLVKWFEYLNCDYSTNEYELDHIKPRCAFNLKNNIEERYICHNWTNLRLITPYENNKKGSKVDNELIQFYLVIADVFIEENKDHIIFYEFLYEWQD